MSERGVSTVLDVVLGLLLVGLAAGVLVTSIPQPADPPTADGTPSVLGSTLTVEYETSAGAHSVEATVGTLLGDAILASHGSQTPRTAAFRSAVETRVSSHLETHGLPVQLVGSCRGNESTDPLVVGPAPPGDQVVRATVYQVPAPASATEQCEPVVVVRRWSR
ncbi:hypothetical protein HTSR_1462 [Halodesulfurarchaeum formicicum]|uniref:Uncharacterized protein n=1 Tax=Halodesulfurarchaeum formicicum TaxID=1873524 RepID=A0A1D8S5K3_9EURY|nr:hypothetical protein [Halodesulfurarchaeum formicicum]AOW80638.1 hypothetical protein HTSR_1462 [Halodesulfurarchaeum formicicum]